MTVGGVFLRVGAIALRGIEFCASAVALAIYSYFLAVLADHDAFIAKWIKAVEGLAGAAVLYTIFGLVFTLCLGGVSFFAFLAIVLDLLFCGAFIAIAIMTRHGAGSCNGFVNTPLGSGYSNPNAAGFDNGNVTYVASLRTACHLNTAVFAVSIINIFFFLITAIYQVALVRHHKKEKRYGPSPANNYTSGRGRGAFWKRKQKHNTKDAEAATALPGTHENRYSNETGTTYGNNTTQHLTEPKYGQPGYGNTSTNY